jgi:hypothetical protein
VSTHRRPRVSPETVTRRITLARGDKAATAMLLDVPTPERPFEDHHKGTDPACRR